MSYITNQLAGNITVSGELLPSSNTLSLGSPTQTFGNLYVGPDSIVISNPNPSVPPTDISISAGNLLVINRGGLAIKDDTGLFDVFQLDPVGTLTIRSNVSVNPLTSAVAIIGNTTGDINEPQNTGVMLHLTGLDSSPARIYNDAYGSNAYAAFIGRRARGTAAVPLQVLTGDIITRIGANPYSTDSFASISTTRIDMVATENQTDTAKGSNVQIWATPIGSNVIARIATFGTNGIQLAADVSIVGDLSISGNSSFIGTTTSLGDVLTYGNLLTYGNTVTYGTLTTNGNAQIQGPTTFSGNVTAIKGIVFSDGSNVTTAGVSYINPGSGLAVTSAANNGINLTTSAVLGIAGTVNQVYVNRTGGNVTLSLPQDLNTNSSPFFGNLTVGNLTVTGNITATQATELQVTNRVIYAANGAITTSAMDLGGFVLGNSEVAASMLYSASPPGWNFNTDIYAQGNVYIGTDGIGDLHARTAYISSNLEIGIAPPVEFPNANLQVTGTAPNAIQVTIQNILADPNASSDFVATADSGDDTTNYVDFGINSSNYSSVEYSAQKALDGYFYSSDSNLVISTAAVGKQIVFTTGGIQTANIAAVVDSGRWIFGGADDLATKVQIDGGLKVSGNVVAGNVTVLNALSVPFVDSTITKSAQPNITSLGLLSSIDVNGNAGFRSSISVIGTARIENSVTNASAFAQTLNVAGLSYANQFVSNLGVTTGSTLNVGTVARVNSLISNTTVQVIGTLTSQSIVNNTGIQSATLNVTGAAQVDSMTTNLLTSTNTFNVVGLAITDSLLNNVRITTQTINSTSLATFNNLVSNTNTTTATLNTTGVAQVNSLISNTNIFGSTLQSSSLTTVNQLISNTSITTSTLNSTGAAVVSSLVSNSTVQAASGVIAGTFTSNTSVTAPAVNATTALWGQTVYSNTSITAAATLTAQSVVSNSSIAGQTLNLTGALQAGSIQGAGNLVIGSVNANVSVYATKFYGDGSGLTGIAIPPVYSNINVASYLTGPILIGNLTVGNVVISNVGNINAGNVNINQLAEPQANADAATKFYVDSKTGNISGIGNLTVSNTTISTSTADANILIDPNGTGTFVIVGSNG